ncbi:MAG: 4-(cytidine 5'-diphospho)-2-C-methyl-D-erythritol kinase [Clostridia bacterium]|nr:4-(cytidine 5'-diphospho)-2-C-methyl-D-erythritol kinase [Clostridia bacterium]
MNGKNTIKEVAPCKVNLFLDITGKRADGYHGIESVMATLGICDEVTVEKTDDGISVRMESDGGLSDDLETLPEEKNLAYKAAKIFLQAAKLEGAGVRISIIKRIPSRAGLGGGSADAAAVLRGMNRLFGSPFSEEELQRLGLTLGADVPFCVSGGFALCRGIGEEITKIDSKITFHGVIISENAEKKSTAEAYAAADRAMCSLKKRADGAVNMASFLEAGDFDAALGEAYNVFAEAGIYPDGARELLSSLGARYVVMSGSGPSVAAYVETEDEAARLFDELTARGIKALRF